MSALDIPLLLSDAQLVLDYAVRAGKLKDSALPDAIEALASSQSFGGEAASRFQQAFSNVVVAIAPMTLIDLRAGRSPFDPRNMNARKRWQVGLSAVTVALIASIAFYQFQVQQQNDALQSYQEATTARIAEKVTAARLLASQALNPQSCSFNDYQRARHELRQLDAHASAATATLQRLMSSSPWPFVDLIDTIQERLAAAAPPLRNAVAATVPDTQGAAKEPTDGGQVEGICSARSRQEILVRTYPDWLRQVVSDGLDDYCFADRMNLPYAIRSQTLDSQGLFPNGENPVPVLQQRGRIQTAWVLPFLYGLLGACVYVMRRLLFDARAAVVENLVILLRLALGALAGVVIGWFASPSTAGALGASSAVSWQYVLAFLAGFSIDNLFHLLDRANRVLSGRDKTQAAEHA